MNIHRTVFALVCAVVILGCETSTDTVYTSALPAATERVWIGPEYYANRLMDWRLRDGRLECVEGRREDQFGVRFEGSIEVDQAGSYTFYTRSDDGSKLYVDGTEVVDNDGSHGALEESGEITLEPGRHTVVVAYFENGGGEHLEVLYHGPGVERQMLSSEVFRF